VSDLLTITNKSSRNFRAQRFVSLPEAGDSPEHEARGS
jgi:hypothetical protein